MTVENPTGGNIPEENRFLLQACPAFEHRVTGAMDSRPTSRIPD